MNAADGSNGKKIELIMKDTSGKSDVGHSETDKLIAPVKAIVTGEGCSNTVTWAAIAIAQQNRLPILLAQWISDELEIVWPEQIATLKYIYPTPK